MRMFCLLVVAACGSSGKPGDSGISSSDTDVDVDTDTDADSDTDTDVDSDTDADTDADTDTAGETGETWQVIQTADTSDEGNTGNTGETGDTGRETADTGNVLDTGPDPNGYARFVHLITDELFLNVFFNNQPFPLLINFTFTANSDSGGFGYLGFANGNYDFHYRDPVGTPLASVQGHTLNSDYSTIIGFGSVNQGMIDPLLGPDVIGVYDTRVGAPGRAQVRVIHTAVGAGNVDIHWDGVLQIGDLPYKGDAGYRDALIGFQVWSFDHDRDGVIDDSFNLTLADGSIQNVYLMPSGQSGDTGMLAHHIEGQSITRIYAN